jgi:hypothetical protein
VVNEIVPAGRLLARAHEIADGIAAQPPVTSRYARSKASAPPTWRAPAIRWMTR